MEQAAIDAHCEAIQAEREEEQVHLDARAEAQEMEREEAQAREEGYCIHCGSDLDDCTGYKCWIR